jgi:hypothetical protein
MLQPRHDLGSAYSDGNTEYAACEGQKNRFQQELHQDGISAGSDRAAHANFFPPLGDANQRNAHDHESADPGGQDRNDQQKLADGRAHGGDLGHYRPRTGQVEVIQCPWRQMVPRVEQRLYVFSRQLPLIGVF